MYFAGQQGIALFAREKYRLRISQPVTAEPTPTTTTEADCHSSSVFISKCTPNALLHVSGVLWRGGGLPEEHRGFYVAGVKYRVPGFLATSASQRVTDNFTYKVADLSKSNGPNKSASRGAILGGRWLGH
jgi:hypothetical protein